MPLIRGETLVAQNIGPMVVASYHISSRRVFNHTPRGTEHWGTLGDLLAEVGRLGSDQGPFTALRFQS